MQSQSLPAPTSSQSNQPSTLIKISEQIGGLLGSVDSLVAQPSKSIEATYQSATTSIISSNLSDEMKSKVQNIKNKAWSLNEMITEMVRPATSLVAETATGLKDRFDESENKWITKIRNFGKAVQSSLNQGYSSNFTANQSAMREPSDVQMKSNSQKAGNVQIKDEIDQGTMEVLQVKIEPKKQDDVEIE